MVRNILLPLAQEKREVAKKKWIYLSLLILHKMIMRLSVDKSKHSLLDTLTDSNFFYTKPLEELIEKKTPPKISL